VRRRHSAAEWARTVEPAVLCVGAVVTVSVAEPVVGRGVAVAVVDEESVVVDAVLREPAGGGTRGGRRRRETD
jgi:hypothetical protein